MRSVAGPFQRSWIELIRPGLSAAGASVRIMLLRCAFRLDPAPGQRMALARAFGCARVVYNAAIAARERARAAGEPFPTAAVLSRTLLTEAKKTPERHWLGEVSAVVLQQALRDAESAYRNYFASLEASAGVRNWARRGSSRARTVVNRSGSPRTPAGSSPRTAA